VESKSVLRFINLLATSRWRFRSASEIVELMGRSSFYSREGTKRGAISAGSIKTYVARAEGALHNLWCRLGNVGESPTLIARESRGRKEVAYKLLCTAEFEHI
jgi:hypothetical protein